MISNVGENLIAGFRAASDAQDQADKAIEAHFRPIVERYLNAGDFEAARAIASKCMSCGSVSGVFLMDTVRQAQMNICNHPMG